MRLSHTRTSPLILCLALALPPLAGGCYAHGHASVTIRRPPPPLRVEVRPPPPYRGAVWVDGYWTPHRGDYRWTSGYWVRPRPGYVYVQPRWEHRGGGYVYVDGGWRSHGRGHAAPPPRRSPSRAAPQRNPQRHYDHDRGRSYDRGRR